MAAGLVAVMATLHLCCSRGGGDRIALHAMVEEALSHRPCSVPSWHTVVLCDMGWFKRLHTAHDTVWAGSGHGVSSIPGPRGGVLLLQEQRTSHMPSALVTA